MGRKYLDDRPFRDHKRDAASAHKINVFSCIKYQTARRSKSIFGSKQKLHNIGSVDKQLDEFFSQECKGKEKPPNEDANHQRACQPEKIENKKILDPDVDEGWYSRENSEPSEEHFCVGDIQTVQVW